MKMNGAEYSERCPSSHYLEGGSGDEPLAFVHEHIHNAQSRSLSSVPPVAVGHEDAA